MFEGDAVHFQGQQLVSRETQVASRSVVALAASKIFVVHLGIGLNDLQIMNVTPGQEAIGIAADILLVFLMLNHLLSWLGDLHSFKGWNSETKVSGVSLFGAGGSPLQSKFEAALGDLSNLRSNAETKLKDGGAEQIGDLLAKADKMVGQLDAMNKSVRRLNLHAGIYLWVWFLAMPLGLAAYALCL